MSRAPKRAAAAAAAKKAPAGMPEPRRAIMVKMDEEVRNELDALANDRKKTVQELGLEAICDLLRKHGRPVSMRDAFRQSVAGIGCAVQPARRRKSPRK